MKTKLIGTILVITAIFTIFSSMNLVRGTVEDTLNEPVLMSGVFDGGSGEENDPFLISNAQQFAVIADLPEACYELKNDITLPSDWTPIGTNGESFSGILNGAGYTVSVSGFSDEDYIGIFKINNGEIMNLKVKLNLSGKTYDDKDEIFAGSVCGENSGIIRNCSVTGAFIYKIQLSYSGWGGTYAYLGCITGLNSGVIENSCAKSDLQTNLSVRNRGYVGGIAGYNSESIKNSYYIGSISSESQIVGGLIGYNSGTVENTYAVASVFGDETGGLVGDNERNALVINSYYDKDISGLSDTGKGEPKSALGMKIKNVYNNWDFEYVWAIGTDVNDGYPYLIHETAEDNDEVNLSAEVTGIEFKKTANGVNGNISVRVYNQGVRNTDTVLIVGIYDQNSSLAGIEYIERTITPGINDIELSEISADGTIQSSYSAKVFIWDSVNGMIPYINSIPFSI